MNRNVILIYAFLHALGAVSYILLVAFFMTRAQNIIPEIPNVLGVAVFLLIFSISAAVMGVLVFGRPIVWYIGGFKRESFQLIFGTVGCMMLFAIGILLIMIWWGRVVS